MSEESGPARDAILSNVRGISVDPQGRVLVSVARGIWRVESDGTFRRHIGFGQGDGAPRREIRLDAPEAMARDAEGNIAVFSRATIRRLGADGSTSTLAGKHLTSGHAGDGGPAANAMLGAVRSLASTLPSSTATGSGESIVRGTSGQSQAMVRPEPAATGGRPPVPRSATPRAWLWMLPATS
jgi:hypothetical protein